MEQQNFCKTLVREVGVRKMQQPVAAVYQHADGTKEPVTIIKQHSDADGGGYTIFIPSLNRERQTVAERLEFGSPTQTLANSTVASSSSSAHSTANAPTSSIIYYERQQKAHCGRSRSFGISFPRNIS